MRWFILRLLGRRLPSLKEKLILPMLAAALIPMTVFMLMVTVTINRSNYASGRAEADKLVLTLAEEFRALETNAGAAAQTLVNSPSVRAIFRELSDGASVSDELDHYKTLTETVKISTMVDDFYRIRVYFPESVLLTKDEVNFFSLSDLNRDELPESMLATQKRAGWSDWHMAPGNYYPHNELPLKSYWISAAVKGKSGGDLYVAVDISLNSLKKLMSEHNEIICEYSLYDTDGERLLRFGTPTEAAEHWLYRAQCELTDGTRLCVDVDLSQFTSDISQYLILLLHVSLICLILIPCVTILILNKQCSDLEDLADANLLMAEGNYELIAEDSDTREVRTIQRTHNRMVARIDDLIHNVYEEQIKKQEAQLNCLFEQIKPHFLYNTLESGKWMAVREGDKRTAKFLEKLAKYFRIGLGAGMDLVPLHSELEHIKLYIELINMRLSKQIVLETVMEPGVPDCLVLRMLLQPLVENAVEHGICALDGPTGTVRITASKADTELTVCVENDGVPIPEEKLAAINLGQESGLGLANIRKRLKLYYGDGCSVRIENRESNGVRTTISIPLNQAHSILRQKL